MSCSRTTGLNTGGRTWAGRISAIDRGHRGKSLGLQGGGGGGGGAGKRPRAKKFKSTFNFDILYSHMALWDSKHGLSHPSPFEEPKLKSHSPLFSPKPALLLRTTGKRGSLSLRGCGPHGAALM